MTVYIIRLIVHVHVNAQVHLALHFLLTEVEHRIGGGIQ